VVYGSTCHGFRPKRHVVIVREGHYADEYEISAADCRRLRAMGVLAEAEQVPAAARCLPSRVRLTDPEQSAGQ
jgi:hypothetical protein